jgi:hypothetical protein
MEREITVESTHPFESSPKHVLMQTIYPKRSSTTANRSSNLPPVANYSADSLICAYEFRMRMGEQDSAIGAETQSRRSMAMIGDNWRRWYRRFNQTTGTTCQLTTKQREESDREAHEKTERRSGN